MLTPGRKKCRNGFIKNKTNRKKDKRDCIPKTEKKIKATKQVKDKSIKKTFVKLTPKVKDKSVKETPVTPKVSAAKELYDRYYYTHQPPLWPLQAYNLKDPSMKEVCVYTTADSKDPDLLQCLIEREPVNIAMKTHYTNPSDSGYTKLFKKNKRLGPNLAVYAHCKMSNDPGSLQDPKMVHMINSIAFAFDDIRQPDYLYYMQDYNSTKEKELLQAMTNVCRLIFACAIDKKHNFKKICLSYVGGGWFKHLFKPTPTCKYQTYLDLFMAAFERANCELVKAGVVLDEVNVMDNVHDLHQKIIDLIQRKKVNILKSKLVGRIPAILDETSLFVNAWDPHSVVGNGNSADPSLDGFCGRLSNLALLCTPSTNPYMLNNIHTVSDCK